MRKVLLFSGGYDSTCLLADLVEESSHDNATVVCVTIQHNLTGVPKLNREATAQKQIIDALQQRYPDVTIEHEVIQVQSNWNVGSTRESIGLSQPIFWCCNLIPLLNSEDVIYFGYVLGDQAPLVKQYIDGMIYNACQIQDGKSIKVKFPYQWERKDEVIYKLVNKYTYLVDLCTSCESLEEDENVCGKCEPCTHLKQTLVDMLLDHRNDKFTKRAVRKLLKNLFNIRVRIDNLLPTVGEVEET